MSEADEALVRKAQGGDRAAFEEMVRRTSRLVFARLYLETGDAHRAEDAYQATWLVLARKAATVRPPGRLATWLHGVARHLALKCRRADTRRRQREARFVRQQPSRVELALERELRDRLAAGHPPSDRATCSGQRDQLRSGAVYRQRVRARRVGVSRVGVSRVGVSRVGVSRVGVRRVGVRRAGSRALYIRKRDPALRTLPSST